VPRLLPRQERHCHSYPLAVDSFREERVGARPFLWLAVVATLLVPAHVVAVGRGLLLVLGVLVLDLFWLVALALFVSQWRDQRRLGLARVRLDSSSFYLGDRLTLHVCNDRGFGGLSGLVVWLRCIDAVREMRETTVGQDGQRAEEEQQVCYVVWADDRRAPGSDLSRKQISFSFALPTEVELGDPVGAFDARYWEVEVQRIGGASLNFQVLVSRPGGPT